MSIILSSSNPELVKQLAIEQRHAADAISCHILFPCTRKCFRVSGKYRLHLMQRLVGEGLYNIALLYHKKAVVMPKIYDCTMLFQELDMLETRMHILGDVVDHFVVCEAAETHSGQPKPYYFKQNLERFVPWADKIIYVPVDDLTGSGRNSWERERYHRSCISRGFYDTGLMDWIIVGDVDEIPDPECVSYLPGLPSEADHIKFELDMYYYDLNHRVDQGWAIGASRRLRENDPNRIRTCANEAWDIYQPAGWHFSYFGGPQQIIEKHAAFMHHDDPGVRELPHDPAYIAGKVATNQDLYGRDIHIDRVPLGESLPRYIMDNLDKYRAMGWVL